MTRDSGGEAPALGQGIFGSRWIGSGPLLHPALQENKLPWVAG